MENRKKIEYHIVPFLKEKVRLQDYPIGFFKSITTKSALKKTLKKGLIFLNGKKASSSDFLKPDDLLELFQDPNKKNRPTIKIVLEIIFEDEHLALVNKPAGITVSGNKKWTLENALSSNLTKSNQKDALDQPEPIHRLDHPTSGIILIGKTSSAVIALNKTFENREIQKKYLAVTIGKQNTEGTIETPVDDKKSKSYFKVLKTISSEKFEFLNLVELIPETGRKHQLRKHLASIGNPILGDKEYFIENKVLFGNGLYLHAHALTFYHPVTSEEKKFTATPPKKFKRLF